MNNVFLVSLLIAVCFGIVAFALNLVKKDTSLGASGVVGGVSAILILIINFLVLYFELPPMRFSSLWGLFVLYLVIVLVASLVSDFFTESLSASTLVSLIAIVVLLIIMMVNVNGDVTDNASAHRAANFLNVVKEDPTQIPDTDTNNMLIVPPDVAKSKVSAALSNGQSGALQLGTYTELGDPTLQWIGSSSGGHLYYAFQPQFDGAGNKYRLNGTIPGYFLFDAENPDASPIERFGAQYEMHYSIGGGQGQDVLRYAYTHGYDSYYLDDPTLEIADNGTPYVTITLLSPSTGWTRPIPVGLLVVNPNTGNIVRYGMNNVPSWVDRVYGSDVAKNMVNTWAYYSQSGYNGAGSSNAGRYQVSGDPALVYTREGHASWLMLLTSMNSDISVWRYVLFDTQKNQANLYQPAADKPIAVEKNVLGAFNGTANGGVKSNGYSAQGLTLHRIYGEETWVVTYVSNHNGQISFAGMGMLRADDTSSNNVAFGATKEATLQQYQTNLANAPSNGAPQTDSKSVNVTGAIASRSQDVENGQTYVYLVLTGDPAHVYRALAGPTAAELLFCKVGDTVAITYQDLGQSTPTRNVKSFDDKALQLQGATS